MIDLEDLEAKARAATQPAGIRGAEEPYLASEFRLIATLRVVLELIERIRAAEAKAGEPVAWEVRYGDGSLLTVTTKQYLAEDIAGLQEGRTIRPLYAAPVDAAALLERITQLEQARDRAHNEAARLRDSGHPDMQKLVKMTAPVRAIHMRPNVGGSNE